MASLTDNFTNAVQNQQTSSNAALLDRARSVLKNNANVGEAVVNIFGSFGIAGFRFHIPISEQVKMQSDITDHYIDANTAVQDHIAVKPIEITLNGLVGDYFYSVNELADTLALVTPTLSLVKQFLPRLTDAAKQIKLKRISQKQAKETTKTNITKNTDGSYSFSTGITQTETVGANQFNGMDLLTLFIDLYKLKSAQTRAFLFFQALWQSRALMSVETSWRKYDNMAVTSIMPLRDNNADITDFTITFKQVSIAKTQTDLLKNVAGRLKQQAASVTGKGVNKGTEVKAVNVST